MSLATYSDLLAACQNWLFGRADLQARVPEFVALCEAKLNRNLFVRQMETRATTALDPNAADAEFISLPGNFQTMRRVRLINPFATGPTPTTKPALRFATGFQMDELREENPNPGEPVWFSIFGDEVELCPPPDQAYSVEMVYRATLPPLGTGSGFNATNWLMTTAPDAYLYGTMLEAAAYLHEDERISTWSAGLASAVKELNALDQKSNYGAGPLTIRRVRRAY